MAATAAPATYFIPPPPLPEYYLSKNEGEDDKSSTCSEKQEDLQGLLEAIVKVKRTKKQNLHQNLKDSNGEDAACVDLPPVPGDRMRMMKRTGLVQATSVPLVTVRPLSPPGVDRTNEVPPLAIYHICRICLRPRSARYHQEHPIPLNGLPPPPGICRRCRVTSVEEKVCTGAEVQQLRESNETKFGLACLVSDEGYVTSKEMKERRARRLRRSLSRHHLREEGGSSREERKNVIQRAKVRHTTSRSPGKFRKPPQATCRIAGDVPNTGPYATTALAASESVQQQQVLRTSKDVTVKDAVKVKSVKATVATQGSRSPTGHVRKAAMRGNSVSARPARPEHTDSEIRRVAHEEVERYRQAERKLAAHPDAYAYGRIVPVQQKAQCDKDWTDDISKKPPSTREERTVYEDGDICKPSYRQKQSHRDEKSARLKDGAKIQRIRELDVGIQREKRTMPNEKSMSRPGTRSAEMRLPSDCSDGPKRKQNTAYFESYNAMSSSQHVSKPGECNWGPRWLRESASKTVDVGHEPRSTAAGQGSTRSEKALPKHLAGVTIEPNVFESEPPVSVKLKEVLGGYQGQDRARAIPAKSASGVTEIWLPPETKKNVIEVIEEIQVPRLKCAATARGVDIRVARNEAGVPEHVKDLRGVVDRKERVGSGSSSSQALPPGSNSSKKADREYWYDGDVSRTASGFSAKQRNAEDNYRQEQQLTEDIRAPLSLSDSISDSPSKGSDPTPEDRSHGPKVEVDLPGLLEEPRLDRELRCESMPSQLSSSRRSQRSARLPSNDYMYIQRTVQPVNRLVHRTPYDGHEHNYNVESEKNVRQNQSLQSDGHRQPSLGRCEDQERTRVEHSSSYHSSQAKASNSNHSSRVRFATNIEFSPTPPGSDASSGQFRSFAGHGVRDPKAFGAGEKGEDLIAEYERRGRIRSRAPSMNEGDYRFELETVRAWDRDQTPRPSSRQIEDGRKSSASWKHTPGQLEEGRPLAHALSESPSREELRIRVKRGELRTQAPYREEGPRASRRM